jgi:hypothetical protein
MPTLPQLRLRALPWRGSVCRGCGSGLTRGEGERGNREDLPDARERAAVSVVLSHRGEHNPSLSPRASGLGRLDGIGRASVYSQPSINEFDGRADTPA